MQSSQIWETKKPSFGFVSTRFRGNDGVSLETAKWASLIRSKGCPVYFMAGDLDTDPAVSQSVSLASFQNPDIAALNEQIFIQKKRTREASRRIQEFKEILKDELESFYKKFKFDVLVVQNALTIPLNIPLGLAITEFIVEHEISTIAHHHDFFWERQRFSSIAAIDYLRESFPPTHPCIQHVVINSIAGDELSRRTGVSWTLIPNILDFKEMPPALDDYSKNFKKEVVIDEDALVFLQPTRIVSRKGIETSIELVKRLGYPKAVLLISHEAGDEGFEYRERIQEYADFMGIDMKMIADRIAGTRAVDKEGRKRFTLQDVYLNTDFVTYPSLYEGFGNTFIEAVYFRKPVIVNRYAIYEADIEPKGFEVISFNGYITRQKIDEIRTLLEDKKRQEEMAEINFMLGWRYFSYEFLTEKLEQLLVNIFGSKTIPSEKLSKLKKA
jgi:glycosyltransferase involved in cell wall biosynthesis